MLLNKKTAILIFAFILIFLVGCSGNTEETKNEATINKPTSQTVNDYKIDFSAIYNPDTKCVDTTLTNNTGKNALLCSRKYMIYKKNGDDFKNVTPEYAVVLTPDTVFPDKGKNTYNYSYPMFNVAGEGDSFNYENEFKNTKIETGTYKIVVTVDIANPTVYGTLPSEAVDKDIPDNRFVDLNKSTLTSTELKAEFTV